MLKLSLKKFENKNFFDSQNDYEFFQRVYNGGDLTKYINRLNAIGFTDKTEVFDHGCGFGQWSFALSDLNSNVISYDIDFNRIEIANEIKKSINRQNIYFTSVIDYEDHQNFEKFDLVFSYGVLQCLDYKIMLKNYFNFLKPGGRLYFTAADLGWFIYYIIEGHNDTENFTTRDWGIQAIDNSLNYFISGEYKLGANICIPYKAITDQLEKLGFRIIGIGADGSINLFENKKCESFFPFEKYNLKAVYEVLCEKI